MKAQPLLYLGDRRRNALLARLVDSARRWRGAWAAGSTETFEAQCEPPAAAGYVEPVASISTSCWALEIAGERQAVLLLPHSTFLWAVHDNGVPVDAGSAGGPDTIAEKLEHGVAMSLFIELFNDRREAVTVARVPADSLADWSRHSRAWQLNLRAAVAGRSFTLLVSAQRLEMLAPARAPLRTGDLASRRDAVGGNQVALRAVVGDVEMSVSELAQIAIDDVLVLDQHLGEPVALLAAHSRAAVAAGNLGRAGARRAIKLTSISAHKN